MFARRNHQPSESFSKTRPPSRGVTKQKRSFREGSVSSKRVEKPKRPEVTSPFDSSSSSTLTSPIITLIVGSAARLFACHESVLVASPFFEAALRGQFLEASAKRVNLPDELAEVFSSVLEYLYKGDYYPRLLHNKRRNAWELEDTENAEPAGGKGGLESTVVHPGLGIPLLKDTLLYCAAEQYGLEDLKRLALRKQGLRSGIQCATILASARYAYDHTPESDSKLRAHYLALIIRSRHTFKRSGTMQMEMEAGGRLFFDLFVAMSNHMDDISSIAKSPLKSPLKSPGKSPR